MINCNKIEDVVLIRVCILGLFVLYTVQVRVSNPQRLTCTQIFLEYPPTERKATRKQAGGKGSSVCRWHGQVTRFNVKVNKGSRDSLEWSIRRGSVIKEHLFQPLGI